jgi:hypothetical protein
MTGYSGTPLAKKLGIKEQFKVFAMNAPAGYPAMLAPLPASVTFVSRADDTTHMAHIFTTQRAELSTALAAFRKQLASDAMVWVSWPKKSSKVPSEVTEDTVRELALPLGFVDVKVCAVDDVWSGLKLVVRKELR